LRSSALDPGLLVRTVERICADSGLRSRFRRFAAEGDVFWAAFLRIYDEERSAIVASQPTDLGRGTSAVVRS
jgi:hypothetical protein